MRKSLVVGLSSIIVMSVLASGCAPQRRQPSPDVKKVGKGATPPGTQGAQGVDGKGTGAAPTAPGLSPEMAKQPEVEKLEGVPLNIRTIYRNNNGQRQADGSYTGDAGFQVFVEGDEKPIIIKISDNDKKGSGDIIVENNRLKGGFVCTDLEGLKKGITQCDMMTVKITEMDGKPVTLQIEEITKTRLKVDVSIEAKALVTKAAAASSLVAVSNPDKAGRKTFLLNYIRLNDAQGVTAAARSTDKATTSIISGLPEKNKDGKSISYEKTTGSNLPNAIGSVVSEATITIHNVNFTIEGEKPVIASFTVDRNGDVDSSSTASAADKTTTSTSAPEVAITPEAPSVDGQPPAPAVGGGQTKTPAQIAAERKAAEKKAAEEKAIVDRQAQELADRQAAEQKAKDEAAAQKAAEIAAADKKAADESAASIPYGTALLNGTVQMLTHPLNFFFGW